jgi:hypothetical protein
MSIHALHESSFSRAACAVALAAAVWSSPARADDEGHPTNPTRKATPAATAPRSAGTQDSSGNGAGIALTVLGSAAIATALVFVAASLLDQVNKIGRELVGCDPSLGEHCDTSTQWLYPAAAVAAGVAGAGLLGGGIALIRHGSKRPPTATQRPGALLWMPSGVAVDSQGVRLIFQVAW